MKSYYQVKPWLIAGMLAIIMSGCATTQDENMTEDGTQATDGSGTTSGTEAGANATAIADGTPMAAREMLEKTEGTLANRTIYFEFDSAKLSNDSVAILETHGNFVSRNSAVSVRLEGHADERGSREYNVALGERRAQSVKSVFLLQGATEEQVETISYGEERPVMSGHDEESWSKNRRVELVYTVN